MFTFGRIPLLPDGLPRSPPPFRLWGTTVERPRRNVRLGDRDPSDPERQAVELAQRGRIILDVAQADFEESEAALGLAHPTTLFFQNALSEAKRLGMNWSSSSGALP